LQIVENNGLFKLYYTAML